MIFMKNKELGGGLLFLVCYDGGAVVGGGGGVGWYSWAHMYMVKLPLTSSATAFVQ